MINMSEPSLKEKMKEVIIEWDEDGLRTICKSAI
jgi:hypothetical protein